MENCYYRLSDICPLPNIILACAASYLENCQAGDGGVGHGVLFAHRSCRHGPVAERRLKSVQEVDDDVDEL